MIFGHNIFIQSEWQFRREQEYTNQNSPIAYYYLWHVEANDFKTAIMNGGINRFDANFDVEIDCDDY